MRVLVTGGTGYVGAHSVKALVDAGHDVQLLVRNAARIAETLAPLGVDRLDHVSGDMTDPRAVTDAMKGCDAVLHCAAVVSLARQRAAEVLAQNPEGTRIVLDAAVERGLDPIVHVSSVSAIFDPADRHGARLVHRDSEIADPGSAYGRSKAAAERHARARQTEGAPVVITYPAGVCGPAAGPLVGEIGESLRVMAASGIVPMRDSRTSYVDVRDVGLVHAAVMEPGRGPRRFVCGGHTITTAELATDLRALTGRPFPVIPIPGMVWRSAGRLVDLVQRAFPLDTVISQEAMTMATRWIGTDDRPTLAELGIRYRDLRDTIAETLRALRATGRISGRQLGALATEAR